MELDAGDCGTGPFSEGESEKVTKGDLCESASASPCTPPNNLKTKLCQLGVKGISRQRKRRERERVHWPAGQLEHFTGILVDPPGSKQCRDAHKMNDSGIKGWRWLTHDGTTRICGEQLGFPDP